MGSPTNSIKRYSVNCRMGQSCARSGGINASLDLDPTGMSELSLLKGDADSTFFWLSRIRKPEPRYIQATKATKQFGDGSFMDKAELPSSVQEDWFLPVIRAAASVATSSQLVDQITDFMKGRANKTDATWGQALVLLSNACRNGGELEAGREFLMASAEAASRFSRPGRSMSQPGRLDLSFMNRRQAAFHDLLRIVDFRQYLLFPCSGTLLGLYRDKDFIPSDGDVDIGCLDEDGFEAVRQRLREAGVFHVSPGRKVTNFNAKHVLGPKFDISLYISRGNLFAKTSHVYEWQFEPFELGELATDYGRLPVPNPTDKYLKAMYEDWWVPRSGYDSRIDSPNVSYVSKQEVVLVMAGHFISVYIRGDQESCSAWRKKFSRLPEDVRRGVNEILSPLI